MSKNGHDEGEAEEASVVEDEGKLTFVAELTAEELFIEDKLRKENEHGEN